MTSTDCLTCGMEIPVIWGGEEIGAWTGKCRTCGTIITATKEELR